MIDIVSPLKKAIIRKPDISANKKSGETKCSNSRSAFAIKYPDEKAINALPYDVNFLVPSYRRVILKYLLAIQRKYLIPMWRC